MLSASMLSCKKACLSCAGAYILDVNVGVPGDYEAVTMKKSSMHCKRFFGTVKLIIFSPLVLEQACRQYNGKPLINSVNGKVAVMMKYFRLLKNTWRSYRIDTGRRWHPRNHRKTHWCEAYRGLSENMALTDQT